MRNRRRDGSPVRKRDAAAAPACYQAHPEVVAAVAQREGIDLVVLFGSAARNQLKPDSDVDIAVRFVGGRPDFETEARVAGDLHVALRPPRELDLVVLNGASPLLLACVTGDGLPLYEATPDVWPLFRIYAKRLFADSERFRRRHWQALKERCLP